MRTRTASENLTAKRVEHFIPMIEDTRIISGRHQRMLRPLLGNYIPFIITEFWKSLRDIRGIAGILLSSELDHPAYVRQQEIDVIRSYCVDDVYRPRMIESQRGFYYGQRVIPQSGPFATHVGRYDAATKRGDAALFMLFGREQRVVFKQGELIAA